MGMNAVQQVDAQTVLAYFERLDPLVRSGTVLHVIGGSAVVQLGAQIRVTVRESIQRLPERFCDDVLIRENLINLESDLKLWKGL